MATKKKSTKKAEAKASQPKVEKPDAAKEVSVAKTPTTLAADAKKKAALKSPANSKAVSTKPAKPKAAKTSKGAFGKNNGSGGLSALDAAAKVLGESGGEMNCRELVEAMAAKGYWKSDGKTPAATLYSAILREGQNKGGDSRFRKAGRGKFALAQAG